MTATTGELKNPDHPLHQLVGKRVLVQLSTGNVTRGQLLALHDSPDMIELAASHRLLVSWTHVLSIREAT